MNCRPCSTFLRDALEQIDRKKWACINYKRWMERIDETVTYIERIVKCFQRTGINHNRFRSNIHYLCQLMNGKKYKNFDSLSYYTEFVETIEGGSAELADFMDYLIDSGIMRVPRDNTANKDYICAWIGDIVNTILGYLQSLHELHLNRPKKCEEEELVFYHPTPKPRIPKPNKSNSFGLSQ